MAKITQEVEAGWADVDAGRVSDFGASEVEEIKTQGGEQLARKRA